jgi:hypothetical protein
LISRLFFAPFRENASYACAFCELKISVVELAIQILQSFSPNGTPAASQGAPKGSTSTVSPNVKKLSPKGGAACFRACMRELDSSWGNFCDYSCYGG